jgi:hypothetical protein
MSKSSLTVLIGLAGAFGAGCGEGPPKLVEVEGVVTLNGEPLEKIRVEFWPFNDGPQSAALTDEQGRFTLLTWDGEKKGAILGKHKVVMQDVSIVTRFVGREDVDVTDGRKPRIAYHYTNATTTPLELELTGERRDLVLEVEPYTDKMHRGFAADR